MAGKDEWTDSTGISKFNPGDKVTIKAKKNIRIDGDYPCAGGPCSFYPSMAKYCGKKATITGYNNSRPQYPRYELDIDGGDWHWIDDFFE